MDSQVQHYFGQMVNNKSETYLKLESLCDDVKKSWFHDRDETNSMKEIIELIEGMLVMTSLEEYFSNNKSDLDYFMGNFSKEVIANVLQQPVVYGDNGDEIALNLLYSFIKLFMHFHKNREYAPLFEKIRQIFNKDNSNSFFYSYNSFKKEISPQKRYTYEQFNDQFCKEFKNEIKKEEPFKIGDKVDVLIKYKNSRLSLDKKAWVRGIISDIKNDEYIIEYPSKSSKQDSKINYPIDSPNVLKEGTKTEDWEWRLSLNEKDIIDCYDRSKWYPSTICEVSEYKNPNGLIYKEYRVGFRLYPDYFIENKKYDYDTFLQCTIFWDNPDNLKDNEGNAYFGDREQLDETISFYSKRIQKFKKYSSMQKEIIKNKQNNLMNSFSTNNISNIMNTNMMSLMNQKTEGEDKMKLINELLEKDNNEAYIDEFYLYEKDGKKNNIIGKDKENFSYYFAILLKKIDDDGFFEEMINILKESPTVEEVYNIFYILMNSTSFIHRDYFKNNYNVFKNAFFNMMDNLSSKELRNLQKELSELGSNFFLKINYVMSPNKINPATNEINLILSLKNIKSSVFDKKIQGLKSFGEYISNCSNEEDIKNVIELIKKNEIIKELFGTNYHTQIISKSKDILELMLKNDEITEEELKLIWSLTEHNDLEAKSIVFKLLTDLIAFFNEKNSNIILGYINNEKDKKFNDNEIELIYNLSIKGNNEEFMSKCCKYYCKNVLEVNNYKNLAKNQNVGKLVHLFGKEEKYSQIQIEIYENDLKLNKNVLPIYFVMDKIIEKYKNNILADTEENNANNNFINRTIKSLTDNNKLLNIFTENFISYKKKAKDDSKYKNEKSLIIDGFSHEDNMKYRVLFLIKVIPILYPKFYFFELLKEICLNNPVYQSDKLFFYDFMKNFISESKPMNNPKEKDQKIALEIQLFNMLNEENKNELTLSLYNLYIEIFLEINTSKELLSFNKNEKNEYIINIYESTAIDDIFGIDKLWDLLFQLIDKDLANKLINIIYSLYKSKNEIQKLMDKCTNIIKDKENITYNKLIKCIDLLKFIIIESEKNSFIGIKSHNNLLKDFIIYIPLEFKNKNGNNHDIMNYFNGGKANTDKNTIKDLLLSNSSLLELKEIISEKFDLIDKNIDVVYSYKEKNSIKTNKLDCSYDNKSIKELLKLDEELIDVDLNKILCPQNKLIFSGEKKEKETFNISRMNNKFENMIKEWFSIFTNGNDIMDKDAIISFISVISSNKNVDENNEDYIKFIQEYDKAQKSFILEDEFLEYFNDLSRTDPDKMKKIIKDMHYGEDYKKITEPLPNKNIDKNSLPRYILGNDSAFHDALISYFMKFENKLPIYEFLFFLITNEKKYNELLDNFEYFFNENNDKNYIEQLYEIIIIESFLQDLEVNFIDLNKIIKEKKTKRKVDNFKIISKKYIPFDDEKNIIRKRSFLINFIGKGGYTKLIKYIENLFDTINDNSEEQEIKIKCCQKGLKIINSIYNSFLENNLFEEKYNNIYVLGNNLNFDNIINIENNNKDNEEKINALKKIIFDMEYHNLIEKIISFFIKTEYSKKYHSLLKFSFKLLIYLITSNETLFAKIKNDAKIKENFSSLIKNDITSSKNIEKFFLNSLIKFINNQPQTISNKLISEFCCYLFDISNTIFKELINNDNQNKNEINSNSYCIFFDYFSNLFKIIVNNKLLNLNDIVNNEFIYHIIDLIYKFLKDDSNEKKLSEDTFLGFMKILVAAINSDKLIKNEIIHRKINDETLLELIYNIIFQNKENDNINQIINENSEIEKLKSSINYYSTNDNFIKMENLTEAIKTFNNNNKLQKEEEISQKVYDALNDFIIICLSESNEPELFIKILNYISSKNNINENQILINNNKTKKLPKAFDHVGLKNIGCICYLNSILQQMYMIPSFRFAIMSVDDKKNENYQTSFFHNNVFDDNLLHQLQKMYTFLTYSEKQAYNPKDFCASFKDFDGAPINPLLQQDSQEFFNNLCDKIENNLKDTKYKYIIENIITGKTCSSVTCERCNSISNRFEDFYNLTLEVKNISNLYESLNKLIEPEKIEQFQCDTCKDKVTISKRTSLAKLPNVLFIHLKRFYMDYELGITEKINSKFEFPNNLNLKPFCTEEINKGIKNESDEIYFKEDEYYEYELKGINVHMGNAQGGHYMSFIDIERDGQDNNIKSSIENNIIKSKWLKFNDSIITEFDTENIPIESFGGRMNNNSNENNQNAYLLIYERKKKTPIKIRIDKEDIKDISNKEESSVSDQNINIIKYQKEKKASINKYYDISNLDKSSRVKEEELYKLYFCEEDSNECYVYVPYYNIEKAVPKRTFIEVMKNNIKFFKKKKPILNNYKYISTYEEALMKMINLKEFNILDNRFLLNNKKQLISFFNDQTFENKVLKNNNVIAIEDEKKSLLNKNTSILLDKIIMPIINSDNKNNEFEILIQSLNDIFIDSGNLDKIFEDNEICKIFDIHNVKKMSEIIHSLFNLMKDKKDIRINFIKVYKIMDNNIEDEKHYLFSSEENDDYDDDNNKKEKKISSPTYYLLDLLYKIILKEENALTDYLISQNQISNLLGKINNITSINTRNIIYNIIVYLINHCYEHTRNNTGKNSILPFEKESLKEKFYKNKSLIKKLIVERNEIVIKIIKIIQYNDSKFSDKFNIDIVPFLFNFSIKNNQLTQLLDILFEIINIKDSFTLKRLYIIMGYPDIIVKHQIKDEDCVEDDDDDDDDYGGIRNIKIVKKKKVENENSTKKFFPLFGYRLLKESQNGEVYKYISNSKIYERHCILAQLFPCTNEELYENIKFWKKGQKLSEEERKEYIYKLLRISLLDEGNYCLFKYIYLTQSRFILKYANLYEEMIDILSKEEKYNLSEIKKNAEICIKRIEFEVNTVKKNLEKLTNKNLEEEDDNINNDSSKKEEKEEDKKDSNEIPELPSNMMENYVANDDIQEFTGFIPDHIPDSIEKVVYSLMEVSEKILFICVKYYTTFQSIKLLRKKDNTVESNNNNITDDSKDKIIEEEKEKEEPKNLENIRYNNNNSDSDNEMINNIRLSEGEGNIYDVNIISISERIFLNNAYSILRENKKIVIKDKFFNKSKETKLSLMRYLYFLNRPSIFLLTKLSGNRLSIESKYNSFIPRYSNCYASQKNYADIVRIYRRNKLLDFIKENSLSMSIKIRGESNFESEYKLTKFSDSD